MHHPIIFPFGMILIPAKREDKEKTRKRDGAGWNERKRGNYIQPVMCVPSKRCRKTHEKKARTDERIYVLDFVPFSSTLLGRLSRSFFSSSVRRRLRCFVCINSTLLSISFILSRARYFHFDSALFIEVLGLFISFLFFLFFSLFFLNVDCSLCCALYSRICLECFEGTRAFSSQQSN